MTSPPPFIEAISQRLDKFATERREEALELGPEAVSFTEHALAGLQGGKRLRARFCWWGWRGVAHGSGVTESAGDAAVGVRAALEIFQSAALAHDDLFDNSNTRRGRPSAHRALEAAHRAASRRQ